MMITRINKIRMMLIHSEFREMRRQFSFRDHLSAVHNLAVSSGDDDDARWYRGRTLQFCINFLQIMIPSEMEVTPRYKLLVYC